MSDHTPSIKKTIPSTKSPIDVQSYFQNRLGGQAQRGHLMIIYGLEIIIIISDFIAFTRVIPAYFRHSREGGNPSCKQYQIITIDKSYTHFQWETRQEWCVKTI